MIRLPENLRAALDALSALMPTTPMKSSAETSCRCALQRTDRAPGSVYGKGADAGGPLLNIVWCARALERIGTREERLEYVVYLAGGRDVRHRPRPEQDDPTSAA